MSLQNLSIEELKIIKENTKDNLKQGYIKYKKKRGKRKTKTY